MDTRDNRVGVRATKHVDAVARANCCTKFDGVAALANQNSQLTTGDVFVMKDPSNNKRLAFEVEAPIGVLALNSEFQPTAL
jgi:hypothetical protein